MIDFITLNTYGIKKVIYLESVESTNKFAKEEITEDDVLVSAGYQFAGKGRFNRKWESEKNKNAIITIVKNLSIDEVHLVNFYVSYIILRAIKEILIDDYESELEFLKLKWPNDLLLNGKKIAGILTELVDINEDPKRFIIGIGVNINQEYFSEDIIHKATSLNKYFNREFDTEKIVNSIIKNFYDNLSLLNERNILMEIWRLNAEMEGKLVRFIINENHSHVEGEILEVQDDGGIKIKISDNSNPKNICTYYTGEISFIY